MGKMLALNPTICIFFVFFHWGRGGCYIFIQLSSSIACCMHDSIQMSMVDTLSLALLISSTKGLWENFIHRLASEMAVA